MSENQVVYKVRVGSAEYGADDQASAQSLAELLGGEVFTVSKQQALNHVRTITKVSPIPAIFQDFIANAKDLLMTEIADLEGTEACWELTMRRDSKMDRWYIRMRNRANGGSVFSNLDGTEYASVAHARWENGLACTVDYLQNSIRKAGTGKSFSVLKAKPAKFA